MQKNMLYNTYIPYFYIPYSRMVFIKKWLYYSVIMAVLQAGNLPTSFFGPT